MKIAWVSDWNRWGNGKGYTVHNGNMRNHCARIPGVEITDDPEGAKIVVDVVVPTAYYPTPGKFNVLFCLAPDTRILTTDLRWKPVGDVNIGDELIGFPESLELGHGHKYGKSMVRGTSRLRAKALRIITTTGDLIASANHMWVTTGYHDQHGVKNPKTGFRAKCNDCSRRWTRTDQLQPGMVLVRRFEPWSEVTSCEAGWLAGFLDGEGCVNNCGNGNRLCFSQKPGDAFDHACEILRAHGFTFNKVWNKAGTWGVQIHNGIRALGMFRTQRLLPKAGLIWEDTRTWSRYGLQQAEVLAVEEIGEVDLVGTLTDTNTLIAEGILSHNTMYEMGTLPPSWIKPINTADLIVVPCRHNQRLFRQYTKKPVEVCPEGVDPQLFRYHPRQFPAKDEYFNFLWVGASNPRKGFELVCAAWEGWLKSQPQMIVEHTRLILKTTKESVEERVRWMFGAIIDERRLTDAELIELYNHAHAFLLPSMGEGWGLTLNEAAATGLPCIYTPWSGPVDFMDPALSYPAKWRIYTIGAVRAKDDGSTELAHSGPVALANTESLIRRMEQIYYGYSEALERGRRMAEKIHREFTWDRSARKFIEIIARHTGEKLGAAA